MMTPVLKPNEGSRSLPTYPVKKDMWTDVLEIALRLVDAYYLSVSSVYYASRLHILRSVWCLTPTCGI